jgi:hypothetical protein
MINISQSFLKEFNKYKLGETCGLQVKAKYIDDNYPRTSSEVMDLGNFFEFNATGSLPRDGQIPMAKVVYKDTPKQKLDDKYQRSLDSAVFFKKIIQHYGIEIKETGKVVTQDGMTGILDIYAEWNGRHCIIDTKYSGLLYDRWSEFGWDLDSLPEKHNLMLQPVQYKILMSLELDIPIEDIDFYFFVFSSTNPNDAKIIKVVNDETTIEQHHLAIKYVKRELAKPIENVFKAKPELLRCFDCALKDDCSFRIEVPQIQEIYY